jgi:hypothetical protein
VLLTLLGFASGYAGLPQIAPKLSRAELPASSKGVLVVAARMVGMTQSATCDDLELTRAADTTWHGHLAGC